MADTVPMMTLTDADYARFHKLAPEVLKGRTRGRLFSELDSSFQFLVAGALPILGVALWEWSATNWLVFLVIGCWIGLLCDVLRLKFLKKEIDAYCSRVVDDTFVSVVSEAMRADKKEVVSAQLPQKPDYSKGVLADLVFGAVSSLVIFVSLPENLSTEVFDRPWFLLSLIAFVVYRLGMTIWEIVDLRTNPQRQPVVKLALALRGAGMFITMFIVVFVCGENEDPSTARYAVYGVSGAVIAMGVLNLWGMFLMLGETRWLRKYLAKRNA